MSSSTSASVFPSAEDRQHFFVILREFAQVILALAVLMAMLGYWTGFFEPQRLDFACDAEKMVTWRGRAAFLSNGQYFGDGHTRTDAFAHSGRYSLRLDRENQFGFSSVLPTLYAGDELLMTAWRYIPSGHPEGVVLAIEGGGMAQSGEEVIERTNSGWAKIKLWYKVPPNGQNKLTKFYLWNWNFEPVYVDD
ncbi:MAG: hypothetical protein AAGD05_15390, partial [Bacteroidota bacterium]